MFFKNYIKCYINHSLIHSLNLNDLKIEHRKEKAISLEFSLSFLFLEHFFLFLEIDNEKNVHFFVIFYFERIYSISRNIFV